jgi:CRP-like cAMP-binding protein
VTANQTSDAGDEVERRGYAALVDSLNDALDVRGGLAETVDRAHFAMMSSHIAGLLDLEAGLQAALARMGAQAKSEHRAYYDLGAAVTERLARAFAGPAGECRVGLSLRDPNDQDDVLADVQSSTNRPAAGIALKLIAIPFFRVFSREDILATAQAGLSTAYARGEIICHQGDPGDRLYVVIEGLVKIVFISGRGDEMVLNILGSKEIFGELALLDGSPRSASVVALKSTSIFMLPRVRMLELMRYNPGLADEFLRLIGGRIRKLTEQVGDSGFLDLGGRLAALLLQLSVRQGNVHRVVLDRGLTQSDLAAMIGASRPAVNRMLQSFAARGLITIQGRSIVLCDVDGLRKKKRA